MPSRRQVLAVLAAAVSAGCGSGNAADTTASATTPDATPNPASSTQRSTATPMSTRSTTDGGRTNTSTPTSTTTSACDRRTPEPVPDLSVRNALEESVVVDLTVETTGDDAAVYHDETHSLSAGADVALSEVFDSRATYRVTAELGDGTTQTADVEAESSRYSILTVWVTDGPEIEIGLLNVHPKPTPTPCP